MSKEFFPAPSAPKIYAYSDSRFAGCFKVGYTKERARRWMLSIVKLPNQSHKIELDELAVCDDGRCLLTMTCTAC